MGSFAIDNNTVSCTDGIRFDAPLKYFGYEMYDNAAFVMSDGPSPTTPSTAVLTAFTSI